MKYFKKIVGERLYLSPINSEDYELYTKWMNDFETAKYITQLTNVVSLDAEKEYLANITSSKYHFAIVLNEEDRLIGNISLMNVHEVDRNAELGIFIGEATDRNKGYGSEAIKLLLDFSFNYLNFHNIMLKAYSFNERAINAYEKCGFKEFGTWKESHYFDGKYYDEVFMSILKDDFNKDQHK